MGRRVSRQEVVFAACFLLVLMCSNLLGFAQAPSAGGDSPVAARLRKPATYYVSAQGTDANDGSSPSTPWRTISKVNGWTFVPGDTLRFQGAEVFSGPLTNESLVGSPEGTITINSYGTGNAIIDGGNKDGIALVNAEFLTLTGLSIKGSSWTGSGPSIQPVNGGTGIRIQNTRTQGNRLRNITISNCNVSGFYYGVILDTMRPGSTGFENVKIAHNNFSNNLGMGFNLQGYKPYEGGPVDQNRNIYIGYNTIENIPGDPHSGSGGIHGTFKTESGGLQVTSATGVTMEDNYLSDIAGFGGLNTGLVYGGSTAIVVTNSRSFRITRNEITRTKCITRYDGSAIDVDQDGQDGEIDGNLTYNNVGPGIQIGSFGGKVTRNIRIHHNISYNDVRGNNAGGESEQGAIRIWGNTDNLKIFNNTIYVGAAGAVGIPSVVNFEQVSVKPGDFGQNAHIQFINNIFKIAGGVPIFWADQKINPTHLGVASALANLYDPSGGRLFFANDDGSSKKDITTLEEWRAAGFEVLHKVKYGIVADTGLADIASFTRKEPDLRQGEALLARVKNFDLKSGSAAIGAGIDPTLPELHLDLDASTYHGPAFRPGQKVDVGAVPYTAR